METLTTQPKVQINGSYRLNAQGEITERTLLLNIREDNVFRAVQLFNQLNGKITGNETFLPDGAASPDEIPVIDEAHIFPFGCETAPRCPECDSPMTRRNGKSGEFWGCIQFKRNGCRGTRQI